MNTQPEKKRNHALTVSPPTMWLQIRCPKPSPNIGVSLQVVTSLLRNQCFPIGGLEISVIFGYIPDQLSDPRLLNQVLFYLRFLDIIPVGPAVFVTLPKSQKRYLLMMGRLGTFVISRTATLPMWYTCLHALVIYTMWE